MSSINISKETWEILSNISSRIGKSKSQIVEDLIKNYEGSFWAGFEQCLTSKRKWYRRKEYFITKEITICVSLPMLEATYGFLWEIAEGGINVNRKENSFILKAYLKDLYLKEFKEFLLGLARHHKLEPPSIHIKSISFENKKHDIPFIIVPAGFDSIASGGIPIILNPGLAFGKGDHPCTIYCLKALSDLYTGKFGQSLPKNVLDAGTGTGILSIASVLLGAKEVVAVDIDRNAIEAAKSNVILNHLNKKIEVILCPISKVKGHFDLILANLYGMLLKEISGFLISLLNKGGWLIIGGMITPDDELVIDCFKRNGMKFINTYRDEKWAVAVLKNDKSLSR